MQLDLETNKTLAGMRQFLEALASSRTEVYEHAVRIWGRFSYWKLCKAEWGLLRAQGQGAAFPAALHAGGHPASGGDGRTARFALQPRHDGAAARVRGIRGLALERLTGTSNGHRYNLRRSQCYVRVLGSPDSTRPSPTPTGERRKPRREGRPGKVRFDSVH